MLCSLLWESGRVAYYSEKWNTIPKNFRIETAISREGLRIEHIPFVTQNPSQRRELAV
jgi:hypothetical protein